MTNIAMENPNHKWRFLAGKIHYKWDSYTMAMLNNQRVYMYIYIYGFSMVFPQLLLMVDHFPRETAGVPHLC